MAQRPERRLRRGRARREPRRIFHLFCEGRNTEPGYFTALRAKFSDALIEIRLVDGAGDPSALTNRAIKQIETLGLKKRARKKLNSFEEKDTVWVVFDRDEHAHYYESIEKCTSAGIGVARSNPCFELWLILHYCDFDKPDGHGSVQAEFKRHDNVYASGKGKNADFQYLMSNIESAENRAIAQLVRREKEGTAMNAPSTTVFELTRAIRHAANQFSRE